MRSTSGFWIVASLLLGACGPGMQTAPVERRPPAPVVEDAPGSVRPTEAPSDSARSAAAPDPVVAPAPPPPVGREYPPAIRIGARVRDIRVEPEVLEVQVGDSLSMGDVRIVPVDESGQRVDGVRVMQIVDSRVAILEEGVLRGLIEGEAELTLSILAPPASGAGRPEVKVFRAPIRVVGAPVVSLEIQAPGSVAYVGAPFRLGVVARTEDGSPRERVAVEWSTGDPAVASVDRTGLVSGRRTGRTTLTARVGAVDASVDVTVRDNPVASLTLSPDRSPIRTGDVVRFGPVARDGAGTPVADVPLSWSVVGFDERGAESGATVYEDGAFVAERPGLYRVTARTGSASGDVLLDVVARDVAEDVVLLGTGVVSDRPTSDLWAFTGADGKDYVYTGTHSGGQRMLVWDVSSPASPVLTDYVEVDARVVNDVKVNADASLAVITREGASDRKNGIVILDLTDPAHPVVRGEYTETLTGGVHNTFIVGDLVYAVHNGTAEVHILDISDPGDVEEVGRWGIEAPGKYLHDIWVVDGLAYVSYWNDGVWILDVGDGRWGGTPTKPVPVSSYAYPEGNTHVAFPYVNGEGRTYLFVGDEIFGCQDCISRAGPGEEGPRGYIHILDASDPQSLREVARYEVPEAGAHNVWVEEDRLYVAYYQAGLRVVDVSGELRGDLYGQGREIAWFPTGSRDGFVANSPMAWGPQPFKGNVFVSDLNSGLWVVRLEPRKARPLIP